MNRFQIAGLAMIFAYGMAFAQVWWNAYAPHGQVAFPWVVECKDDDSKFDVENPNNECFKKMGGWWWSYVDGPAAAPQTNDCRKAIKGVTPSKSTAQNYVKAKINGAEVSMVGPDYPECEGPAVTNKQTGESYLASEGGLSLELAVGTGVNGPDVWKPSIAAIGVKLRDDGKGTAGSLPIPDPIEVDMTKYGGFCLAYESDHTADDLFYMELGWDQVDAETKREEYDAYTSNLKVGTGVQIQDFVWSTTCEGKKPRVCGNFEQEGWSDAPIGIEKAITKMTQVNVVLKSYVPRVVKFKIIEFGPKGTCTGNVVAPNPIIATSKNPSVNFTLNGKMLTASIAKPSMVQIYNLQGAIVKSQTLSPNSNIMNLGNLPTGIYMVRAPSLGYTSRIVIK